MKKLFSTKVSDNAFSFAMLVFRLGVGGLMLANHGWKRISNFSDNAEKWSVDFLGLGTTVSFTLLVFAEFFCAAFIILGLFTRLAAIPLIIAMGYAFFVRHKMNYGEGEGALLFLVCFLVILINGPGKWSVDRLIGK